MTAATVMMNPVMTGLGMLANRLDALGRNASEMNAPATQYPTLREATPVIWTNETMVRAPMLGGAPARPAIRLPAPVVEIDRCTSRKSTARAWRHEL